jgi:hypothetical protein
MQYDKSAVNSEPGPVSDHDSVPYMIRNSHYRRYTGGPFNRDTTQQVFPKIKRNKFTFNILRTGTVHVPLVSGRWKELWEEIKRTGTSKSRLSSARSFLLVDFLKIKQYVYARCKWLSQEDTWHLNKVPYFNNQGVGGYLASPDSGDGNRPDLYSEFG